MSVGKSLPAPASATVKGTFAYITIKDRLPVTVTKAIDYIHRSRQELMKKYSDEADADCKLAIDLLGQLRYELQTDKPWTRIKDNGEDAALWNDALDKLIQTQGVENCSWFKGSWLFSECYLYRRIREAMLSCKTDMKNLDPFEKAKIETHDLSHSSITQLIKVLCPLDFEEEKNNPEILKRRFNVTAEALLWANKNDLSLSSGNDVSSKVQNLIDLLDSFSSNIVCNQVEQIWDFLNELKLLKASSPDTPIRIDVVLDNCSIELGSDLIFCDFILRNNFADKIHLHAKAYSWFISDVTKADFDYFLRKISAENSIVINNFLKRINKYLEESKLVFEHTHQFWTSPYSFDEMENISPDLYNDFKKNSKFILFKGDLNYRKIIGDLNWPHDTPLREAIRGFLPTTLCTFRTIKADLVAGIDINTETNPVYGQIKKDFGDSTKWMNTGDYGIIQFVRK